MADVRSEIGQRRDQMRLAVQEVRLGEAQTTEDIRTGLVASFRAHALSHIAI